MMPTIDTRNPTTADNKAVTLRAAVLSSLSIAQVWQLGTQTLDPFSL